MGMPIDLPREGSSLSFVGPSQWTGAPRESGSVSIVGDHRLEETPVPIPNTAVKLKPPMILPSGKVGHRRLLGSLRDNLREPFSFLPRIIRLCPPRARVALVFPLVGSASRR